MERSPTCQAVSTVYHINSYLCRAFPNLEDLRLWTSAPQLRHLDSSDFPKLHSVLLGGLRSNRILKDLVRVIGHQLTTLKEQVPPHYCESFLSSAWPAKEIVVLLYEMPYEWQSLIARLSLELFLFQDRDSHVRRPDRSCRQ